MSEKRRVAEALKAHAHTAWGIAALSAVDDPQLVFAGTRNAPASTAAGDLLRIYRIRLGHCRERRIETHGIAELMECLAGRTPNEMIEVQPFIGPARSVAVFWDTSGNLMGCVTVVGRDMQSARHNLEVALGKQ